MNKNTANTQNSQFLPSLSSDISMTSKEISELLDVRHDVVVRQIKRLASLGTIELPQIVGISTATKPRTEYIFQGEQGKRDSIIVVAQLSPEITAKLVDRWQELEKANQFDPSKLSRGDILRIALDAEEENQKLVAKIDADAPLVAFGERHAKAEGSVSLREAAKQCDYPPISFNKLLHAKSLIYKNQSGVWLPYSDAQKRGLFDVHSYPVIGSDGVEKFRSQCKVTAKGIQYVHKLLKKEGVA